MSGDNEAFLELDEAPAARMPPADPTPDMAPARDDESFLEVLEVDAGTAARRARVVTDDDLRMVTSLADDTVPLLLALWPARPRRAGAPRAVDAAHRRRGGHAPAAVPQP